MNRTRIYSTVTFFFGNNANSENQQKTNVKPVTTKTRKRNQRDISDESTIKTSHWADKYTDATSKELSSQFELLLVEVREVGDNSLYRAGLSVVGQP